jgi:hypothetical protein
VSAVRRVRRVAAAGEALLTRSAVLAAALAVRDRLPAPTVIAALADAAERAADLQDPLRDADAGLRAATAPGRFRSMPDPAAGTARAGTLDPMATASRARAAAGDLTGAGGAAVVPDLADVEERRSGAAPSGHATATGRTVDTAGAAAVGPSPHDRVRPRGHAHPPTDPDAARDRARAASAHPPAPGAAPPAVGAEAPPVPHPSARSRRTGAAVPPGPAGLHGLVERWEAAVAEPGAHASDRLRPGGSLVHHDGEGGRNDGEGGRHDAPQMPAAGTPPAPTTPGTAEWAAFSPPAHLSPPAHISPTVAETAIGSDVPGPAPLRLDDLLPAAARSSSPATANEHLEALLDDLLRREALAHGLDDVS